MQLQRLTLSLAPHWMYRCRCSQSHGMVSGLHYHGVFHLRRTKDSRGRSQVYPRISGPELRRLGSYSTPEAHRQHSTKATSGRKVGENVQDGLCYLGNHGRLHDDISSWTPHSFYLETYIDLERVDILKGACTLRRDMVLWRFYICIGTW